jgi:hypothetical protein
MRRFLVWAAAASCPALALALIIGCGGTPTKEEEKEHKDATPKAKATFLDGSYKGTITGKVTFEGDKPDLAALTAKLIEAMKTKPNDNCLADTASEDEKSQQEWRIDKDGGLANVFVWIAPPRGKMFKVDMDKKDWPSEVILHQPHCAFIPHCFTVFPKYRDEKNKLVETGQKLIVKNDAPMPHNTNLSDAGGTNNSIPAGKEEVEVLEPAARPVAISCNIHGWMRAYAGIFDHPYATVTKPDGTYEIKNVPVGAEVTLFAWHEKADYLNKNGSKGETVTLKDKNTVDFTAKKPTD